MLESRSVGITAVLGLAWREVIHERLLSVSLTVALAGLLAPILVLFGLKSGVMHALLSELIEDPAFREIKPIATDNYPDSLLNALQSQPEAAFVVGSVSRGASVIQIDDTSGQAVYLDMLPTAAGDPLLLASGIEPVPDSVVLSASAAKRIDRVTGDDAVLSSQRTDAGVQTIAEATLPIVGVLPPHADVLDRVYVPASFARDVESFREGFAVPERNWPGNDRAVEPAYHGVVIALKQRLDDLAWARVTSNTDFYLIDEIETADFKKRFSSTPPPATVQLLDVRVIDNSATESSVTRVRRNIDAHLIKAFPYVDEQSISVIIEKNIKVEMMLGVSIDPSLKAMSVSLPVEIDTRIGNADRFALSINAANGPLTFNLERGAPNSGKTMLTSARLAGILQRARERPLEFDKTSRTFSLAPLGVRGFRLFSRNLDGVSELVRWLRMQGIESRSSVREIRRLQRLDRGLGALFLMIAIATASTAAIVLVANQFSAVERKRSSLARLRLIGLVRADVAAVPVFQAAIIAFFGIVLAMLLTNLTCASMNTWLADSLGFSGAVCRLERVPLLIGATIALGISGITSVGAAYAATRIDPAEGMRSD